VLGVTRVVSLLALVVSLLSPNVSAQAIFLVRHAERADASTDPSLSAAGRARAERLAAMLRNAGVTAIFTTDLKRTIETAAPLAKASHVTATALPAAGTEALIQRLRAAHTADRILVVGHSNTVPDVLSAFGIAPRIAIADNEYDNLFILMLRAGASPQLVRLRY
jgi:broad specificity phosphatase PhoE